MISRPRLCNVALSRLVLHDIAGPADVPGIQKVRAEEAGATTVILMPNCNTCALGRCVRTPSYQYWRGPFVALDVDKEGFLYGSIFRLPVPLTRQIESTIGGMRCERRHFLEMAEAGAVERRFSRDFVRNEINRHCLA